MNSVIERSRLLHCDEDRKIGMKKYGSCTRAAHTHFCFVAAIFLTIALICNGAPRRTTAVDSVAIAGIWKDTNDNTIVVEETGTLGGIDDAVTYSVVAKCVSSSCSWIEAAIVRSAEGHGGLLSITFSYPKPDGIMQVGPVVARISGSGQRIDFFQNNALWIKLGEGKDPENFEAVRNEFHETVVHTGKYHRIKQCRHGLFMLNYYDTWVSRSLGLYGEWSEYETSMFLNLLEQNDVVIDAGANIGAFTIPMAKKVGANGAVYAFEPQRFLSQTLSANVVLNELPNVYTMHMALGDHVGTLKIPNIVYSKPGNFGAVDLKKKYASNTVLPLMTIDSLMLPCPKLIKIDVEGMEVGVLKGGRKTVQKCKPFIYVENNCVMGSKKLILEMDSLGYALFWDIQPYYNPRNFFGNTHDIFPPRMMSINMLGIPSDKVKEVDMSTWVQIDTKGSKFYLSNYTLKAPDNTPIVISQNGNLTSCVR